MFDDDLDMYDMVEALREDLESFGDDDVILPRGIREYREGDYSLMTEDELWFCPVVIPKVFFERMDNREIVSYILSKDLTTQ